MINSLTAFSVALLSASSVLARSAEWVSSDIVEDFMMPNCQTVVTEDLTVVNCSESSLDSIEECTDLDCLQDGTRNMYTVYKTAELDGDITFSFSKRLDDLDVDEFECDSENEDNCPQFYS